MTGSLTLPDGVTINALMRMTATEVLVTYGPEVSELLARLQGSGLVSRDGRSNADLALQREMRLKIAEEGDCEPADTYRLEAMAAAEARIKEEEKS
jgi:hypothetical protein